MSNDMRKLIKVNSLSRMSNRFIAARALTLNLLQTTLVLTMNTNKSLVYCIRSKTLVILLYIYQYV